MKRRLIWMMGLCLLLLLAACGEGPTDTKSTPIESATPEATAELPDDAGSDSNETSDADNGSEEADNGSESESLDDEADDLDKEVLAPEPVIVYERSGGMMGALQAFEVYADGTLYAAHSDTEWEGDSDSDSAEVDDLISLIDEADFADMDESYLPDDTCCDRFTYTITVTNEDGDSHTVTTIDDSDAPDALWEIIDALEQFIRETTA